jgi:hypothetical protein
MSRHGPVKWFSDHRQPKKTGTHLKLYRVFIAGVTMLAVELLRHRVTKSCTGICFLEVSDGGLWLMFQVSVQAGVVISAAH